MEKDQENKSPKTLLHLQSTKKLIDTTTEPSPQSGCHLKGSSHLMPIIIIATVSIVLYANTLKNGFVYDDEYTIVSNSLIKDFNNFSKLFGDDYFALSQEFSYRPIVTFTYFIDYTLFGLKPWGFHLTNIFLHSINGVLLYIFASLLTHSLLLGNPLPASSCKSLFISRLSNPSLLIALLFIAHPVLTEAVNAVSYREDLLVFLFYMTTLNLYLVIKIKKSAAFLIVPIYFFSCVTYFFALLSKEMAVTLPLVIYCYEWVFRDKKNNLQPFLFNLYNIGFIAVSGVYAYIRFYYLYNPMEEYLHTWGPVDRFLTVPWLLLSYIKLIVFPFFLSADHEIFPIKSFLSPSFILPIFVIFFLLTILFSVIKKEREITFCVLFFLITLIPVSNIVPIANPLAERYLYLPATGFIGIMGLIIYRIIRIRNLYLYAFLIIFTTYSFAVFKRNMVWHDNYSLWTDTVKKMPYNSRAHNQLGIAYRDEGLINEAIKEYQTAIQLKPDYANARINLGHAYLNQGRLTEAIQEYQLLIRLRPNNVYAHINLGFGYFSQGRTDEAVQEYLIALKLEPNNPDAHLNLGLAYYNQQRMPEAIREYQVVIQLRPDFADAHNKLGAVYSTQGLINEAMQEYQTAIKLNPSHPEAHFNLGNIYYLKNRLDEALHEYQTVIRLKPDYARAYDNIRKIDILKGLKDKQ